ncbi:LysR family transcriptional regulator [Pendulispora albinea]|uniref:LysR family transcriptional regulator n=1 Tax=Pendulispora albinea TaxID=2741071 RepID=A0ABZ2M9G7_9BACT
MIDFDDLPKRAPRRPKTSELEIVVAIARAGSLGGAAAALGCTQSRVSHALGELEGALGVRLFQRSRVGTSPTEAGAKVVAKAGEALALLDAIAAPRDRCAGTVRIAAYRSVATHLLTPLAQRMATKHPELRLEIDDGCADREDVDRMVREGRADLGISQLPVGEGFAVTPFAQDDYVLVVPIRHRPARASFWSDLSHLPFFELRCSGTRAAIAACRENGMMNRTASAFSSDSTIVAQVTARRGFSILARLAAEPLPPELMAIPLPIAAFRSLVLIRRRDRRSPALLGVTKALRNHLRHPGPAGLVAQKWLRTTEACDTVAP